MTKIPEDSQKSFDKSVGSDESAIPKTEDFTNTPKWITFGPALKEISKLERELEAETGKNSEKKSEEEKRPVISSNNEKKFSKSMIIGTTLGALAILAISVLLLVFVKSSRDDNSFRIAANSTNQKQEIQDTGEINRDASKISNVQSTTNDSFDEVKSNLGEFQFVTPTPKPEVVSQQPQTQSTPEIVTSRAASSPTPRPANTNTYRFPKTFGIPKPTPKQIYLSPQTNSQPKKTPNSDKKCILTDDC
jgi:cytoskeletal protein RodZ